jgi:hypothetical protein
VSSLNDRSSGNEPLENGRRLIYRHGNGPMTVYWGSRGSERKAADKQGPTEEPPPQEEKAQERDD